jgi:hypothetical protein
MARILALLHVRKGQPKLGPDAMRAHRYFQA